MEWQPVGTIITTKDYAFTPIVTGTLFKLKHTSAIANKSNLKIVIRQAFEDDGQLALFDYKLINCKVEQDILLFNLPQGLTNRRLAIKRVDNLPDIWTIEIQTLVSEIDIMPSYSSLPVSSNTTRRILENSVIVYNTPTQLSPYNPRKTGTTITNTSNFNLYVSVGVQGSFDSYDKVLATNEVFETPFNWCGDIFGLFDYPDGDDSTNFAKVKDFLT